MESNYDEARNAAYRAAMDRMAMAVHPAMNAAQGSILGNMGSQMSQYAERRIETMFDHNRQMNVSIISADNGFVVIMRPEFPGTNSRVLVANTIEELRDLITSEMVTRKMEK